MKLSPRLRKARKILLWILAAHVVGLFVVWLTRASWLPQAIAHAPNAGKSVAELTSTAVPPITDFDPKRVHELRVDVGPPAASIALRILDPEEPPRATIFVFHGIRDSKRSMENLGRVLTTHAFRVVLVDTRGHGQSTGEWLSFGEREGHDLVQIADALDAQHLLVLPIGAYGHSYGGSVALQFARRDPRVRAVVSVATFTRLRDIVPIYAHRMAPSFFLTSSDLNRAIDRAGELGEFRPDDSDTVASIAATTAQVLIVHGRADGNIPWEHGAALHEAARSHSRLAVIDDRDHETIMSDRTVTYGALTWFDQWLFPPK